MRGVPRHRRRARGPPDSLVQLQRMTTRPSRSVYYAASLLTVLSGVRVRSLVAVTAMALGRRGPRLLRLRRSQPVFLVRNVMDVWMPSGTHERIVAHLTAAEFHVTLTPNKAWRELGFLCARRT